MILPIKNEFSSVIFVDVVDLRDFWFIFADALGK